MIDVRELGSLQLDGLREVANIGAGHAATALSQLTHRRILLDVPQIRITRLEEAAELVGPGDEVIAAVLVRVLGDATGRTVLILPRDTAVRLTEILLGRTGVTFPESFGELERSALTEAGNILVGAHLSALSDFLGLILLNSVPGLAIDLAAAILTSSYLNFGERADYVFCLDTLFRVDEGEHPLRGHLLLIPDGGSLEVILRAIRLG
ncbi:MAG: chemotaxis protein CheC [Gemmatimonadetes bacterium]|nr:chemotaxis protein CheC [Gemmatimonadota bacterium]